MKIALLGHGNVGRGVSYIIDNGKTSFIKHLEIKKSLVKDESVRSFAGFHRDQNLTDLFYVRPRQY